MSLKIDGIATSEHIDSSGELLIVENHDISDLVDGRGVLNWEHSNKSDDIIGAVIYARKILKKEDCENDRQRKYWETVKKPFVYIIGELFEDEDHPGAVAVAAMIRFYAKKSEKLLTGFSIEGATLAREDYILKESVGRRVAVTLRPCNKTAIAGLYEDPKAKKIAKSIEDLTKTVSDTLVEVDSIILDDVFMPADPLLDLHKAISDLEKTLTAGMGNVAPSQLVGGAALVREHLTGARKNRVKAAIRDWDRKRPLSETIKAALPEVSDDYLHHFVGLAEELALKKNSSNKLLRIGARNTHNHMQNDSQKKLIEGLHMDPMKQKVKTFLPGHGEYTNAIYKLKNDAGQNVMVKNPQRGDDSKFSNAENATHYYHLADEVFGMGHHVPVTNYFHHAKLADDSLEQALHHQAMEIVPRAKTPIVHGLEFEKAKKKGQANGDVHKMMIMDHILGNTDRHVGNVLIHPKGHLMSIDNDMAFSYAGNTFPEYAHESEQSSGLHPEAAKWVKGIDPKALAGKMMDQGHDPEQIKAAVAGLRGYQKLADRPMNIVHMWNTVDGMIGHAVMQHHAAKKAV